MLIYTAGIQQKIVQYKALVYLKYILSLKLNLDV